MSAIQFDDGTISVEADLLGASLGIDSSLVPQLMRQGKITSACERGVDADAGTYRLTFFHASRRVRFVVDQAGRIVRRSMIDFGAPLDTAARQSRR